MTAQNPKRESEGSWLGASHGLAARSCIKARRFRSGFGSDGKGGLMAGTLAAAERFKR